MKDLVALAAVAVVFSLGWFVTLWGVWFALALVYPAS